MRSAWRIWTFKLAYDAATMSLLEEALSEGFGYHRELDSFLLRSGVSSGQLEEARKRANKRGEDSPFGYAKAPKRFVAQEILTILADDGVLGDRVLAALVTAFNAGSFANANTKGTDAISTLSGRITEERASRQAEQKLKESEEEKRLAAARLAKAKSLQLQRQQRLALRDRFIGLNSEANAQARGYLLEQFLNDFFEFEDLDPRASFKITGEQIDGSFIWRQRSNLVECKWTKNATAGAEFGAFLFKIDGKSADTRGLFISINGYSTDAVTALNGKGALKFICLDGTHIMRALEGDETLPIILGKAWRHADETGQAYLPANKI